MSLIQNSDKIEDENGGTKIRMETLTALCRMYPEGAYVIRSKCVSYLIIFSISESTSNFFDFL